MRIIWFVPVSVALCFYNLVPVFITTENLKRSSFPFFLGLSFLCAFFSVYRNTENHGSTVKVYWLAVPAALDTYTETYQEVDECMVELPAGIGAVQVAL